jgi:hypothetical protein
MLREGLVLDDNLSSLFTAPLEGAVEKLEPDLVTGVLPETPVGEAKAATLSGKGLTSS